MRSVGFICARWCLRNVVVLGGESLLFHLCQAERLRDLLILK
jgi:hypothetical protein